MEDPTPTTRRPRPHTSRLIDRLTDALGAERVFAPAVVVATAALVVGAAAGKLALVASVATLITFVIVFAIQHTSSRELQALNLKMDELIRVSEARNSLIGAEDESHSQLDERRRELLGARKPDG